MAAKKKTDAQTNALVADMGSPNSEPQWKFFLSKAKYTCYGGARGGGKSWAIIRKAALLAYNYPGIQILIIRREYDQLENPIIQPMLKLVPPDIRTYNIDPALIEEKITPKTKMIVPVHIGGYPVDLDPIMELAKKNDIIVLEDAAHAFGAMYKGRKIGTIGDFGCYSFHETKNYSMGEGGAVTLGDGDSYYSFKKQLDRFVEFLRTGKADHPFEDTIEMAKIIAAGIRSREEGGRRVYLSELNVD